MADKQTPAQLVAEMRAKNAERNQAIWQAAKRTPGLLAGGAVDAANMLLGLVTGKGWEGLVKKPIGGGESINEVFGMPKGTSATQDIAEAVMSLLSPSGMAKAIILPAALLKPVKDIRDATKLVKQGKDAEAWKKYGVYVDPLDGEPKALLDPRKFDIPDRNIGAVESKDKPFVITPQGIKVSEKFSGPFSNVVDAPELFNKAFGIEFARLAPETTLGLLGSFDPRTYTIKINYMPNKKQLKEVLGHESQHGIQSEYDFVRGSNPEEFFSTDANRLLIDSIVSDLLNKRNVLYNARPNVKGVDLVKHTDANNIIDDLLAPLEAARTASFKNYERMGGEAESRAVEKLLSNPNLAKTMSPLEMQIQELTQKYGPTATRIRGDEADILVDLWPETQAAVQKATDPNTLIMLDKMMKYFSPMVKP